MTTDISPLEARRRLQSAESSLEDALDKLEDASDELQGMGLGWVRRIIESAYNKANKALEEIESLQPTD